MRSSLRAEADLGSDSVSGLRRGLKSSFESGMVGGIELVSTGRGRDVLGGVTLAEESSSVLKVDCLAEGGSSASSRVGKKRGGTTMGARLDMRTQFWRLWPFLLLEEPEDLMGLVEVVAGSHLKGLLVAMERGRFRGEVCM